MWKHDREVSGRVDQGPPDEIRRLPHLRHKVQ
jgi:hypothetical protein